MSELFSVILLAEKLQSYRGPFRILKLVEPHNAMKRPIDPSDIKSLPLHLWPVAWSKANNLISNQILKPKPFF